MMTKHKPSEENLNTHRHFVHKVSCSGSAGIGYKAKSCKRGWSPVVFDFPLQGNRTLESNRTPCISIEYIRPPLESGHPALHGIPLTGVG